MKIFNVFAVLCLIAGALVAEARDIPPEKIREICEILIREPGRGQPDFCDLIPGGREKIVTREARLGRYYRDEVIPLRQLFNIDREFRGAKLAYVEVYLQDGGRGGLTLLLDNRVEDQQYRLSSITRLSPRRSAEIGRDVSSIALRVDDKVYIDKIVVAFNTSRGGGSGYPPGGGQQQQIVLQGSWRQNLRAGERLDIGNILNVYQYQGRQIESVEVQASTVRNRSAQLSLRVNGVTRDRQIVSNESLRNVTLRPGYQSEVGRDVRTLTLQSTASIYVERITIRLAR